jgi:hypothetical protein
VSEDVYDGEDGDEWRLAGVGPFRDGRVHVLEGKCSTCIFRPGNLMRLEAGRVKGMVEGAVANGSCIPCHSTLVTGAPAICRGFWDGYADRVLALRLAEAMEIVELVAPPSKAEVWGTVVER